LFAELVPDCRLTYEQYWKIKRDRTSQAKLLREYFGFNNEQVEFFRNDWLKRVEDPVRLKSDRPFEGVPKFLAELSKAFKLYLVTARQHPDRVAAQLGRFGWQKYFSKVLVTEQRMSKSHMVRAAGLVCDRADILVGDTGGDILAGKELGTITVGVSSGFLKGEILRQYNPDILLETVVALNAGELSLTGVVN
jgi:phosphoglycolate phosphatase-like HAD superfamily hydrolase